MAMLVYGAVELANLDANALWLLPLGALFVWMAIVAWRSWRRARRLRRALRDD